MSNDSDEDDVLDFSAKVSRKRKLRELTPLQRALGLLVRREHSAKELLRKLMERGIEGDQAHAALERLRADGWQSDVRFAEMLVRTRVAQGQGPVRIRSELGTHGLDRAAVESAMDTFEGDWRQTAREIARRRFGPRLASDLPIRRKAADFLYGRGFDGETVRFALRDEADD